MFKMVKLIAVLCVVCAVGSAFSLERASSSRLTTASVSPKFQASVHSSPTFLKDSSADVVAAAAPKKPEQAKAASFSDKFAAVDWKLGAYLAVWYLGNIYCKYSSIM